MCNLVFYMGLVIFCLPSVKLIQEKGIMVNIIIATLATIMGAWLRLLTLLNDNFLFVLLFSIPPACTQVFFLNLISKVSTVWFPEQQRVIATAVTSGG